MGPRAGRLALAVAAVILMVVMLGGAPGVTQAGGSWVAWLYNPDSGQMVQILPDFAGGATIPFPMQPGMIGTPNSIVLSRDATRVASCQEVFHAGRALYVSDIASGALVASYGVSGDTIDCALGQYAFSPDGTQVAFGLLNHYADPADPRPDWVLYVVDLATSMPVYQLSSADPQVTALGINVAGQMPVVEAFEPGVIAFKLVLWGAGGAPEYTGLVWHPAVGDVTVMEPYGKNALQLQMPMGEAIWLDQRADFPIGFIDGMGYPYNVLMYGNKTGSSYPIFSLSGAVLDWGIFAKNGEWAAVRSSIYPNPPVWYYVDRYGGSGALPIPADVYDVWGVSDGYIYLHPTAGPSGGPLLVYHRYTGDVGSLEVQNLWSADPGSYWKIVYTNPAYGTGYPPFPEVLSSGGTVLMTLPPPAVVTLPPPAVVTLPAPVVATLMPPPQILVTLPVFAITPQINPNLLMTIAPTAILAPPPLLILHIGGVAQVHTTEGDMLRVRSGPGTGYGVQFQLAPGVLVNVLNGPQTADGLTWWFIQAPNGQTGWAVEGVPDGSGWLQTLIPVS